MVSPSYGFVWPYHKASLSKKPLVRIQGDIMTARGIFLDEIWRISPPLPIIGYFVSPTYAEMKELEKFDFREPSIRSKVSLISAAERHTALRRALVADFKWDFTDFAGIDLDDTYLIWLDSLQGQSTVESSTKLSHFRRALTISCQTRQSCVTKSGLFGLVSDEAEEGDLLCVLLGGNVLYCISLSGRTAGNSRLYEFRKQW